MLTFARLREGREERLMAVKAAEAMAKARAYDREIREANPDLLSELETLFSLTKFIIKKEKICQF